MPDDRVLESSGGLFAAWADGAVAGALAAAAGGAGEALASCAGAATGGGSGSSPRRDRDDRVRDERRDREDRVRDERCDVGLGGGTKPAAYEAREEWPEERLEERREPAPRDALERPADVRREEEPPETFCQEAPLSWEVVDAAPREPGEGVR